MHSPDTEREDIIAAALNGAPIFSLEELLEQTREEDLDSLRGRVAEACAHTGKVEDALYFVDKLPTEAMRDRILSNCAVHAARNGDRKEAEAYVEKVSDEKNKEQANQLLTDTVMEQRWDGWGKRLLEG